MVAKNPLRAINGNGVSGAARDASTQGSNNEVMRITSWYYTRSWYTSHSHAIIMLCPTLHVLEERTQLREPHHMAWGVAGNDAGE